MDFSVKKALKKLKKIKKAHEAENYLVDTLFQMSSTSCFLPPEKMILDIADSNYGILSEEFKKAHNEIINGNSWANSLKKMNERIESSFLSKAIDVLVITYETGSSMGEALREVAEEISQQIRIQRQRNSALIMQKLTLILAGAFIIPLILGILISMINNFDFSGISDFGLKQINLSTIILANQIYIIEYGLLAAGFISYQENRKENFIKYFLLITPLALVLFNLAKIGLIKLF